MKQINKLFAGFTAIAIAISCLIGFNVSAEDTSGAVITEFGNTSAISGLEYSTTDAYEGERAIHVTKGAELTTPAKLGLTKGGKYNISLMIKGTLTSSNGMYIRMGWGYSSNAAKIKSDASGAFAVQPETGDGIMKATAAENGWYKVESIIPWTCSEMGIGFFNVQSAGGTVDFYMDNLSITDADTGTEIIKNGGFEENDEPIVTPTPAPAPEPSGGDTSGAVITELGNTSAISGLEYSTLDKYEGMRAIHITKGGEMTTPTKLGLTGGKTYNISFMIKGKLTTSNGMYIRMGWGYTANAAKLKSDASGAFSIQAGTGDGIMKATADRDGWYKVESIIPWTCAEMNIGFFNVTSGGGAIDFYIDNLSIVDAETDTEMIANGEFEPPALEVSDFAAEKTSEGKQKVSVTVKNNSAGDEVSALLILATVKDKIMCQKATDVKTVIPEGSEETLETEIEVGEGETLTAYLWDNLSGKKPLRNAEVIEVIQNNQ